MGDVSSTVTVVATAVAGVVPGPKPRRGLTPCTCPVGAGSFGTVSGMDDDRVGMGTSLVVVLVAGSLLVVVFRLLWVVGSVVLGV